MKNKLSSNYAHSHPSLSAEVGFQDSPPTREKKENPRITDSLLLQKKFYYILLFFFVATLLWNCFFFFSFQLFEHHAVRLEDPYELVELF
jgi:hypothetical protein